MKVIDIYNKELKEWIPTAVDDKEDILFDLDFENKIEVKIWTEEERLKLERECVANSLGVKYGKRFLKFDMEKCLGDDEFWIMCKFISKGQSLKQAYMSLLELLRQQNKVYF